MPIIATEGSKKEPIPSGSYPGVCSMIIDLGTQPPIPGSQHPKKQRRVMLLWELPDERRQFERDGRAYDLPNTISKELTLSLHERASMRKFLAAWRGRDFTADELKGFDLVNVLNANCVLNILVKDNGYNDIASIMPIMKGMQKRKPETEPVYFAIDDLQLGVALPDRIPEWVRKKIMRSDEWKALNGGASNGVDDHENAPPVEDDDIPF